MALKWMVVLPKLDGLVPAFDRFRMKLGLILENFMKTILSLSLSSLDNYLPSSRQRKPISTSPTEVQVKSVNNLYDLFILKCHNSSFHQFLVTHSSSCSWMSERRRECWPPSSPPSSPSPPSCSPSLSSCSLFKELSSSFSSHAWWSCPAGLELPSDLSLRPVCGHHQALDHEEEDE